MAWDAAMQLVYEQDLRVLAQRVSRALAPHAKVKGFWICDRMTDRGGRLRQLLLESLDDRVLLLYGRCDDRKPLAPVVDALERLVPVLHRTDPLLIRRYGAVLATLLPKHAESGVQPLRSGLADYALYGRSFGLGDFFQGRRVTDRVIDELVRVFRLACSLHGLNRPIVLYCDGWAVDLETERLLDALCRDARGAPMALVVRTERADRVPPSLAAAWQAVSCTVNCDSSPPDSKGREASADKLSERTLAVCAGDRALEVMQQAWAVSAYECALRHAHRVVEEGHLPPEADPDLLLGLLAYEASRHEDARQYLLSLRDRATSDPQRVLLEHLLGYNDVFGLGELRRGYASLCRARRRYEAAGNHREAAWVENSMAYVRYRRGQAARAVALEKHALQTARRHAGQDHLLHTILHLNLGRLYRQSDPAAAVEHMKAALQAGTGELTTYLLLLVYLTIAHHHLERGEAVGALHYFHLCRNVLRDREVPGGPPILGHLFSLGHGGGHMGRRAAPWVSMDTRRAHVGGNLARVYEMVGDRRMAEHYHPGGGATDRSQTARESRPRGGLPAPGGRAGSPVPGPPTSLGTVMRWQRARDLATEVAVELGRGRTVAWLDRVPYGGAHYVRNSLVLFDPRTSDPARRVFEALGRPAVTSGTLFILPEALPWFPELQDVAGAEVRRATIPRSLRQRIPALFPVDTRVQVVVPLDGTLFELVRAFHVRTGLPALAGTVFQAALEPVVDDPSTALKVMAEADLDVLVIDGWMGYPLPDVSLVARMGLYRPRLSSRYGLSVLPARLDANRGAVIVGPARTYRVDRHGYEVLRRCDGRNTVEDLRRAVGLDARMADRMIRFMLHLRLQGVLHFVA